MSAEIKDLKKQIGSDCFRYNARRGFGEVARLARVNPGFRYTLIFRLARHLRDNRSVLAAIFRLLHRHYSVKYGIQIPLSVEIGHGLMLPHFGGIVVNSKAKIGTNCTILHGVTLGSISAGKRAGFPVVCDGVYLGPGAVVVGNVTLGAGSTLSGGAWVNFDVPSNALVIGNPGKIVKVYDKFRTDRIKNYDP